MSLWGQVSLQEGTRVLGVEIQCLYDHAIIVMTIIFSFVRYMILKILVNKFYCNNYKDNQLLETLWTVFPLSLLLILGFPRIKLLYLIDELELPEATIKVIGHQWYWRYEYSDVFGRDFRFDSYLRKEPKQGVLAVEYRILEVDNRCVVACMLHIRALVRSDDVVHSWAIPSACIKVDAIPGRINQVGLCFLHSGVFYGQCRELCGVNHSFIPVCVEVVTVEVFTDWIIGNHLANSNNGDYWLLSGIKRVWGVVCKVITYFVDLGEVVVKLYVWWWKNFFYYGIYVPIKYTFSTGVRLVKWIADTCTSVVRWIGWFVDSPIDATSYLIVYISKQVYSIIWFSVTKPFEFRFWLAKSFYDRVYKTISFFVEGTNFLFHSIVNSITSFTDDRFKQAVVNEVNINTHKFLFIINEYYNSRG